MEEPLALRLRGRLRLKYNTAVFDARPGGRVAGLPWFGGREGTLRRVARRLGPASAFRFGSPGIYNCVYAPGTRKACARQTAGRRFYEFETFSRICGIRVWRGASGVPQPLNRPGERTGEPLWRDDRRGHYCSRQRPDHHQVRLRPSGNRAGSGRKAERCIDAGDGRSAEGPAAQSDRPAVVAL